MPAMQWSDTYSVNVAAFDKAHKQLFVLFNEFFDAMTQEKGATVIADTLQKCCNYALTHFRAEEEFMAQRKYAGLAAHRAEHQKFAEQAKQLLDDCRAGKLVVSGKVSKFLREWLIGHIMGTDKQYSACATAADR